MYKIHDLEKVVEAVGFADPINGYPDYDYKKGFNNILHWFQTQLAKDSREVKVNGAKEVKKKK